MQLAGSLFLWPGDGPIHRALEIPLAYAIDVVWPKRRVVEVYLNIAEWGSGVYGAEAGAEAMLRKDAAHLTRNEAAAMVAALQDPTANAAGRSAPADRALWVARKLDQRQGNFSCL